MCWQCHKYPPVATCQWRISLKCGTEKGLLLMLPISFPMKAPRSWEESVCKGLLTSACLSVKWVFLLFFLSCHLMRSWLRFFPCQASSHFFPFCWHADISQPWLVGHWYSCDLLIYCINTFFLPSDTTRLLLLGTHMVSSMAFGVSDPPSSAQDRWQVPLTVHFSTNPTSSEIP